MEIYSLTYNKLDKSRIKLTSFIAIAAMVSECKIGKQKSELLLQLLWLLMGWKIYQAMGTAEASGFRGDEMEEIEDLERQQGKENLAYVRLNSKKKLIN